MVKSGRFIAMTTINKLPNWYCILLVGWPGRPGATAGMNGVGLGQRYNR
jgi:hypothetical protein